MTNCHHHVITTVYGGGTGYSVLVSIDIPHGDRSKVRKRRVATGLPETGEPGQPNYCIFHVI